MATKVQICNIALGLIGSKAKIEALAETSTEARYCNLFYGDARDETLGDFPWKFATRVSTLAILDEPPSQLSWAYQYAYPNPCIRVIRILPEDVENKRQPFETRLQDSDDKRVIWTNVPNAAAEHIVSIDDPSIYSRAFIRAFSWRLASYLALPIKGNVESAQAAERMYQFQIANAHLTDGAEGQHTDRPDAEWIRARA